MDMLLGKYPMVNKQWKYVGSSDTIRWSLGDVVQNMYIGNGGNLLNNNGMTPVDIVNENYINGAVMRRGYDNVYSYINGAVERGGYNKVYSYFIRQVEYSRMVSVNGGQEYYIKHHNNVPELLTDPWDRRFIKYMGIVREDMVGMYSDVYEGLSIQSSRNKNVICSVDVTSIEGHRVYCLHLYS
jgi:hypothetical protein